MLKKVVGFILFLALVSSCIPNDRVIYLQNRDDDPSLYTDSLIPLMRRDYQLQPNDQVIVSFFSEAPDAVESLNLSSNKTASNENTVGGSIFDIDKEGYIEINLIGKVKAAGLSVYELKQKLEAVIKEKEGINDIIVRASLGSVRFTIFGEVGAPGQKSIEGNEVNIIQAIAASGDLSINANRRNIEIIRQYPDGARFHRVDVTDRNLLKSEFYFVQPNDMIYVQPLKIREIGAGATALANFSLIVSTISSAFIIVRLLGN